MKFKQYFKKTPQFIQNEGYTGQFENFDFDKCMIKNFGAYGTASLRQIKEVLPKRIFKEFCRQQNIIYYSDDGFVQRLK